VKTLFVKIFVVKVEGFAARDFCSKEYFLTFSRNFFKFKYLIGYQCLQGKKAVFQCFRIKFKTFFKFSEKMGVFKA
jgi:hypothetical protein